ncbi:MAG: SpoIIE family protein phosphatase [Acidobacteriaceae bacterium]
MASQLPIPNEFRTRIMHVLRPVTKWGRATLWLGILTLLCWIADLLGARVLGWAEFTSIVFLFFAALMALRVGYRPLMWRLRNRLVVTYLFIGVMPILLLLMMLGIAGYLFAGQFATYVAISDLNSELLHLQAANDALTAQIFPLERSGKLSEAIAGELTRASDERFPRRTVTVWRGDEGFVLSTGGAPLAVRPEKLPAFVGRDFTGFVVEKDELHLRAVKLEHVGGRLLAVVSDIPITPELLQPTSARLGVVTVLPLSDGDDRTHKRVDAGFVPERSHWFDLPLRFGTLFDVTDWQSGVRQTGGIGVLTRPSVLYATLFATMGERFLIARDVLFTIAVFFGIIEVVALYIGIRLSRSMTSSVAELYRATEHINRGDLKYRVKGQGRDQMAALGQAFNSMTASLARLIDEQKEKQRLENELSIAYEVQELLFPGQVTDLPTLEVHGVCVPARTVSGDYYDFIPLGSDRLVLAVGDISGKGISAALLMATVHAFVRAYSVEPEMALIPAALGYGSAEDLRLFDRGENGEGLLSPAQLMTTLNYQLYRSTPAAKYATLFLGCYDARSRVLTYCNAGHLPPLILRASGEIVPLTVNGTVVGLFNGVAYDESTLVMQPGDIFIAYSDGVTEPENEFGEFGEDRLTELIREHQHKPLPRIAEIVSGAVADWIGDTEQPDDITIVLARCTDFSLPRT